ncbi:MAG: rhamnogalacturonan acetylesterase [Opitutaceae bacterium]
MRILSAALFVAVPLIAPAASTPLKFDFASGNLAPGYRHVTPDTPYSKDRGFGFEPDATVRATAAGVTSDRPFNFSAAVPVEGNYRVTVRFAPGADATVKAELRRLMVERVQAPANASVTRTFIVNTRTPKIAAIGDIKDGIVRLKAPRETTQEAWAWDDLLTLEFNGARPIVSAIEIEPVDVPTIFLIGDSTVCDQSKEPYNSWGQMFTRWFKPEVAIANHGESGETYRDSIGRRRLDKMLSVMKPGDWMLMQFGHNDQKQIAANTGGPFTTYKAEIKQHIDAVRALGGTPVIVSPMERRGFDEAGKVRPSLTDYAEASRQAAKELGVAFIDLNAMSKPLYEALGVEQSALAFAAPGGRVDNTHHNNYGSYQLAKCIVQSIRDQKLPIAKFIVDDFKAYDPAHPDHPETFAVPASGDFTNQRPLGD